MERSRRGRSDPTRFRLRLTVSLMQTLGALGLICIPASGSMVLRRLFLDSGVPIKAKRRTLTFKNGFSGYSQHGQSSQIGEDVGRKCCQGVVFNVPFARGGQGDGGRVRAKPLQQPYTIYVVSSVMVRCHGAAVRWESMSRSTEIKVPRFGG